MKIRWIRPFQLYCKVYSLRIPNGCPFKWSPLQQFRTTTKIMLCRPEWTMFIACSQVWTLLRWLLEYVVWLSHVNFVNITIVEWARYIFLLKNNENKFRLCEYVIVTKNLDRLFLHKKFNKMFHTRFLGRIPLDRVRYLVN